MNMLPKYLKIHGFRSYIDAEINFEDFGNKFVVIGENGAGKSSLIQMITTALYGVNDATDSKGSGLDKCINTDCDYFQLEFCFVMNNVEYLIITKKVRGESKELEFYIDGINQSEKVTETQEKINSVLKMNYNTFLDTVCLGQGQSDRFMNKKPAERKETFVQILDIQKYEQYEKEAKENKKETKQKMTEIENQIDFIQKTECDIEAETKEIESLENQNDFDLKPKMDDLTEKLNLEIKNKNEYNVLAKQNQYIKSNRVRIESDIDSAKQNLNRYESMENELNMEDSDFDESKIENQQNIIDEAKQKISDAKEIMSKLDTQIDFYQTDFNKINKKYIGFEKYNKSVCDFCGGEISSEHKQKHLTEMKTQMDELQSNIDSNQIKIESIKTKAKKYANQGKEATIEKKKLIEEQKACEENKNKIKRIQLMISNQKENLDKLQEEYAENLKMKIVEVEAKDWKDAEYKHELDNCTQLFNSNNTKIALIKDKINTFKKNQKEIKRLKNQLTSLKELYSDYNSLATAFGKSGIPKDIISHDIPEIENETNKILGLLTDNAMSVKYETEKESAKGKKSIDTLDILINDSNGSRSYETYSGGEKFRIDFACHIGLAKFLTKRSGATIDFLIIDEGLGSQDDGAKQKFLESVNLLNGIFKQIMVITHIQDLQNAFEKRVLIQKVQLTGSHVELIA